MERDNAYAAALVNWVDAEANAAKQFAHTMADAGATWDKTLADASKTYADAVANAELQSAKAIIAAQRTRNDTVADAWRALTRVLLSEGLKLSIAQTNAERDRAKREADEMATSIKKAVDNQIVIAKEKIAVGVSQGKAASSEAKTAAIAEARQKIIAEVEKLAARVRQMLLQPDSDFAYIALLGTFPDDIIKYAYNDGLDTAVNFVAGWADALTMGYHKRIRQGLGINGGVREDSYSYTAGFIVGTIHQFALGFSSAACGRGWMMTATRVYDALTTLEGMRDASVKLYNGTASVWDLLNFMPAAGFIAGRLFGKACFGAGTPIRTLDGSKNIEDLRIGDLVLSRHEDDPDGPIEAKAVEAIFVRESALLHLVAGGKTIKTTGEHPFYVEGKGWTAARELQVGDRLVTLHNKTITVEEVSESAEFETVYNVRVADYHTYFVRTEEWDWSVWAHNVMLCSIMAHVDDKGVHRHRGLNRNADDAIANFDKLTKSPKGTVSPDMASAQALATEVANKKGLRPVLLQHPAHTDDGLPRFHIKGFEEWHFWFD